LTNQTLDHSLGDLWKYRFGDYRILAGIEDKWCKF